MAGRSKQILTFALRLALGGLFIFAGAAKLLDPVSFLEEIAHYQLWPEATFWQMVTWFLPTLEIVLGGCLLANFWKWEATLLLMGLMLIFILALILSWSRGLNLECGCFGAWRVGDSYPSWIARDLVIIAVLILLWVVDLPPSEK